MGADVSIEFYKHLFRLKGWKWNAGKMPPVVGKYVNDLIDDRLTPGVLAKLRELNPKDQKGRRKTYNYKFFTPGFGHPALVERLRELVGMEKACEDGEWERFKRVVDRNFPRINQTIPLPLPEV